MTLSGRRQTAQVVALFALGLMGFLALAGLVIDGGTLYLQRRTAQNAADAAALAGTRALQQSTVSSSGVIGDAICTYLASNTFGVTPTASAYFVATDGSTNLGSIGLNCSGSSPLTTIPAGASGVHVDVTIGPYNTHLVGMLGVRQLTALATATAQVGVIGIPYPDLTPLAGCGPDMLVNGNSATPNYNILNLDNTIKSQYMDPNTPDDFILEGSQTAQDSNLSCPAWNGSSSGWKGKVITSGVTTTAIPPFDVPVDTGNGNSTVDAAIVSTCTTLYGAGGDPTGQSAATSTCFLLIPIAAPPNPSNQANIVALGCFKIYDGVSGQQKWRGILEPITTNTCNYGVYTPTWTYGNTFTGTNVMLTR